MIVPPATFDAAPDPQLDPAALAVLQLMITLLAVQVVEAVLGVTLNRVQVVGAPE